MKISFYLDPYDGAENSLFFSGQQKKCKRSKCPDGKKCVNYAQYKNRNWFACQCEAGKLRGPNCKDGRSQPYPSCFLINKLLCVKYML